ncbi:TIGR00725 family protein [Halobacteriales archaeon SW_10_68_16]|nr:MAG: TIGR00725 family protein [Halobacteriales archaeon SW_10_68_16]
MRVSVIGGSTVTDEQYDIAREVGRLLGESGHEVVCGGLGGAMEAVCRGAREAGGHTIGILPSADRSTANEYVDTPIATGIGYARNALVVKNGDAVIAVDGSTGTLSELAFALDVGRPIAGLDTHRVDDLPGLGHIEHVDSPEAAVRFVETAVGTD